MEIEMKKDGSMLNRKFEYCYEEDRLIPKNYSLSEIQPSKK